VTTYVRIDVRAANEGEELIVASHIENQIRQLHDVVGLVEAVNDGLLRKDARRVDLDKVDIEFSTFQGQERPDEDAISDAIARELVHTGPITSDLHQRIFTAVMTAIRRQK